MTAKVSGRKNILGILYENVTYFKIKISLGFQTFQIYILFKRASLNFCPIYIYRIFICLWFLPLAVVNQRKHHADTYQARYQVSVMSGTEPTPVSLVGGSPTCASVICWLLLYWSWSGVYGFLSLLFKIFFSKLRLIGYFLRFFSAKTYSCH